VSVSESVGVGVCVCVCVCVCLCVSVWARCRARKCSAQSPRSLACKCSLSNRRSPLLSRPARRPPHRHRRKLKSCRAWNWFPTIGGSRVVHCRPPKARSYWARKPGSMGDVLFPTRPEPSETSIGLLFGSLICRPLAERREKQPAVYGLLLACTCCRIYCVAPRRSRACCKRWHGRGPLGHSPSGLVQPCMVSWRKVQLGRGLRTTVQHARRPQILRP
jgi:hypothetical protein